MNRREFIKRAFAVGGLAALYGLGISHDEIKAAGLMQGIVGSASPSGGATNYVNDANCQGAWYMNAANDTNETDRSGKGNTLTNTATVNSSTTVPTGYSGKSRDFNGDSGYLSRADASLVGLDINGANAKMSIVAWVRPDAIASDTEKPIISKWDAEGEQSQYTTILWGTDVNIFIVELCVSQDGINYDYVDSTTSRTANGSTWFHVAFVSNDIDLRVYVNGALDCIPVAHTTGIFNSTADFFIGRKLDAKYFDGLIDEVAVFNRELSATEVLEIYTSGISGNKGGND